MKTFTDKKLEKFRKQFPKIYPDDFIRVEVEKFLSKTIKEAQKEVLDCLPEEKDEDLYEHNVGYGYNSCRTKFLDNYNKLTQ